MIEKLDNLPTVAEMMRKISAGTVKSLGQHFIFDLNITDKIARSVPNLADMNVIEVGPGAGSLTRSLIRCGAKSLTVIEKDKRMMPILEKIRDVGGRMDNNLDSRVKHGNDNGIRQFEIPAFAGMTKKMEIVVEDAMKMGAEFYKKIPEPRAVVSNLPYNVGTELLVGWLQNSRLFSSLTLMFQKEVAQRIVARKGSAQYGRLSIIAAMHSDAKILFTVARAAFNPPPKVENVVVQLIPHNRYSPELCTKVEKISAMLFANRRKMIRTAMKGFDFSAVGLTGTERAEELSLEKFIEIAERF